MSDAPAFFRAIEADPDDDTPRLVYADWLDERAATDADRARAEFIRVQCELARDTRPDRKAELAARERELLTTHGRVWTGSWHAALLKPEYRRGFLDPIAVDGHSFASHAASLFELSPLHHLRLVRVRDRMRAIAACPQLALVRRLSLRQAWVRNAEMTAFAASPHLGNIRSLDLAFNQVGIRGATDLATARMPALRELCLHNNPIKDRGLLALAQADRPSLESLSASVCGLRSPGVIGLADRPLTSRLTALRLSFNGQAPAAAWARLAAAPLGRLQRLDLSYTPADDTAVEALTANPVLTNLRALMLHSTAVTDRGVRALVGWPHLSRLAHLSLPSGVTAPPVLDRFRDRYGHWLYPPESAWEVPR